MSNSIIIAAVFAFLAAGVVVLRKLYGNNAATNTDDSHDHHDGENGVCCGKHSNCEKGYDTSNLYFDDEELDRFRGTAPDEYDDEAVEEFREVLYTMDPREVDDWLKSLELREVALPDALKDEVFMLIRV